MNRPPSNWEIERLEAATVDYAQHQGRKAYKAGYSNADNPYAADQQAAKLAWSNGWFIAWGQDESDVDRIVLPGDYPPAMLGDSTGGPPPLNDEAAGILAESVEELRQRFALVAVRLDDGSPPDHVAYGQGADAAASDLEPDANPYLAADPACIPWREGWEAEKRLQRQAVGTLATVTDRESDAALADLQAQQRYTDDGNPTPAQDWPSPWEIWYPEPTPPPAVRLNLSDRFAYGLVALSFWARTNAGRAVKAVSRLVRW